MIKKIYNSLKIYSNQLRTTAAFGFGGMMGNWDWDDMMGFGFGGLMMGIFWIFVILAGFAFFRWFFENQRGNGNTSGKAMDILKEKYAKGEITKEEFETKKKDLM